MIKIRKITIKDIEEIDKASGFNAHDLACWVLNRDYDSIEISDKVIKRTKCAFKQGQKQLLDNIKLLEEVINRFSKTDKEHFSEMTGLQLRYRSLMDENEKLKSKVDELTVSLSKLADVSCNKNLGNGNLYVTSVMVDDTVLKKAKKPTEVIDLIFDSLKSKFHKLFKKETNRDSK